MNKRLASAAVVFVVILMPGIAQADSGSISGATINSDGTRVSVSDMTVVIDDCTPGGFTGCGAEAGIVPASDNCPSGGAGIQPLWSAPPTATMGPRSMSSGPQSVGVGDPVAYRVCLYGVHASPYGDVWELRAAAVTPSPSGRQKGDSSQGSSQGNGQGGSQGNSQAGVRGKKCKKKRRRAGAAKKHKKKKRCKKKRKKRR